MLRLFPLQEIKPREEVLDEPEDAVDERYRFIQETCLVVPDVQQEQPSKKAIGKKPAVSQAAPSLDHIHDLPMEHYREQSDLPKPALAFYNRAGEYSQLNFFCNRHTRQETQLTFYCTANLAGLTVQTLIREVSRLETRWVAWDRAKTKGTSGEFIGVDVADDSDEEDVTMVVDEGEDEADGDVRDDTQPFSQRYMASSPPG